MSGIIWRSFCAPPFLYSSLITLLVTTPTPLQIHNTWTFSQFFLGPSPFPWTLPLPPFPFDFPLDASSLHLSLIGWVCHETECFTCSPETSCFAGHQWGVLNWHSIVITHFTSTVNLFITTPAPIAPIRAIGTAVIVIRRFLGAY